MAKSSRQRPLNISMKAFDTSWDAIFNNTVKQLDLPLDTETVCINCVNTSCNKCASNLTK